MSIIQQGHQLSFADITATYEKLPKGVYMLKQNQQTLEFYLVKKDGFIMPNKIYGDHSIVNRWLKSFEHNSEKNMGIILSGIKGSGKTITAQKFCLESDLPVILITEPFEGPNFIEFITNPKLGKCIIFVDEFEKVYNTSSRDESNAQSDLLSIMDGNFPTSLVFLLTVNEFRVNEYLINRLNRIKYRKHYESLEQDVMDQVIDDMLQNKDHRDSIYQFFDRVNICTFDLLVNIIKEMNLFNEDAISCGKHLNLEVESSYYNVFEIIGDQQHPCRDIHMSPEDEEIEVERISTDYVPYKTPYTYFCLEKDTYKKTKLSDGSFIIEDICPDGNGDKNKKLLKFKFKKISRHSMVF